MDLLTTDGYEQHHRKLSASAVLASISYLDRNDFKQLSEIGYCLISGKDGTTPVLFWVDACTGDSAVRLPVHVIRMAQRSGFRVDVLKFRANGDKTSMTHTMNVLADL